MLEFGSEEKDYLSCYAMNKSKREVFFRGLKVAICNTELNVITRKNTLFTDNYNKSAVTGNGHGFPVVYPLLNVVKSDDEIVEWNIIFTVIYDAVSMSTTFLEDYFCKNDVPNNMLTLLESGTDADVTLLLGNETLKVHKLILKTRSSYFQKMLDSGMQESLMNEIKLDDVNPAIFKEVLKFLYSGLPPPNLSNLAMDLFPLADRFGLDILKKLCVLAIHSILSAENVVDALIMADMHNAQDLKDVCIPVFKRNKREIREDDLSWNRLKEYPDVMFHLLASLSDD